MAARGFGKGLDALIPESLGSVSSKKAEPKARQEKTEKLEGETIVNITKVEPNSCLLYTSIRRHCFGHWKA